MLNFSFPLSFGANSQNTPSRFWSDCGTLNLLRWNDVPRARREFFPQNYNIFSVLSIFKYNPGKTNNKFINNSLLDNFYPATLSYRRVGKEGDELLYTVWSLVMFRKLVTNARG